MSLVVMKFGGTSVASAENRAAAIGHIRAELEQGNRVVAVVSAMGRMGAPYATDTLLSLVGKDVDLLTRDLLVSCGETISACVFAHELARAGIPARPFTGEGAGIRTTAVHGSAEITGMDTANVVAALDAGLVPVITGFQGRTAEGMTTTIGRGGSDTSAVIIGGFLKADTVDIYTDVPGIAKTDPRIVPYAAFMDSISADDMLFLANWGASVIHPKAVAAGIRFGVPTLRVRSTFDDKPGTSIMSACEGKGLLGVALVKRVTECSGGAYELGGKTYAQTDDGALAVLTAVCYGAGEEQLAALGEKLPGVQICGEKIQAIVSMDDAADMTKAVYDILA